MRSLLFLVISAALGQRGSVTSKLRGGRESSISTLALLSHVNKLFNANWALQHGGGRPLTKGAGQAAGVLAGSDQGALDGVFGRQANSCAATTGMFDADYLGMLTCS